MLFIVLHLCAVVGEERSDCSRCDYYEVKEIPFINHSYKREIITPSIHLTKGLETYMCSDCDDTYSETIEKIKEHTYETVITSPTCTEQGYTTYTCECGESYVDDYTLTTGHADNDGNGYCGACNELLEHTIKCNCNCHKEGIIGFFWRIINVFNMLF